MTYWTAYGIVTSLILLFVSNSYAMGYEETDYVVINYADLRSYVEERYSHDHIRRPFEVWKNLW